MRKTAALLSMLFALSAGAAELWRWKDADGVVHYSDRPVQGAERIDVRATQRTSGKAAPKAPAAVTPPAAPELKFTRCDVVSPVNDQVFNGVSAVDISLAVEPGLQDDYQLQVLRNGLVDADWPPGAMSRTLVNVFRGSYTVSVRVLDGSGRPVCTGPVVNYHVRQPSILAPGRRPPAAGP